MEKNCQTKDHKNIFLSKANVLNYLQTKLKKSYIEKLFYFTINEWQKNEKDILKKISNWFDNDIIIRSSAAGEDSIEKSEAGSYQSIPNINPKSQKSVKNTINSIIKSYREKGNLNSENKILVQKQTKNTIINGVAFSRTQQRGLPYFIINYEKSFATDGVTKGKEGKTVKIFRNTKRSLLSKEWSSLLDSILEIEKILKIEYLDIEFGINKKNNITIFQVRPLTTVNIEENKTSDKKISKIIEKLEKKYVKFVNAKNNLGKYTIFSDMADWNPAEIIGNNPHALDYSLYDFLIMKNAWVIGRERIGYSQVNSKNLMVKFGNKPYVDVRTSFNSFLPKKIRKKTKEKLITYFLNEFIKNPSLHDKVEFELIFSCYDFSIKSKLVSLQKYGFTKKEIQEIHDELLKFTNNIFQNFQKISLECNKSLNKLAKLRDNTMENIEQDSYISNLKAAKILLDDCKHFGTIEFSTMARIGFIGNIILNSLVKEKILDKKDADVFMNSIQTPLSKFKNDYELFLTKKISKKVFLSRYGHLRPGTYDITAQRYDSSNNFLKNIKIKSLKKNNKIKAKTFNFDKLFEKHGLTFNSQEFMSFLKNSLREREELKFKFTQNLSDALELIANAGKILGFSREELSHLEIPIIFNHFEKLPKNELRKLWKKKIHQDRTKRSQNESILLPPLISSKNDFKILSSFIQKPNFITTESIESEIQHLESLQSIPNLNHKIVLIENADPGYDWIFTKNPSGLITKYGGVASHMSIRCAEMRLPAAIGCGEDMFEKLVKSSKIILNCKENQIIILEHDVDDKYIEEEKALRLLGYIK